MALGYDLDQINAEQLGYDLEPRDRDLDQETLDDVVMLCGTNHVVADGTPPPSYRDVSTEPPGYDEAVANINNN